MSITSDYERPPVWPEPPAPHIEGGAPDGGGPPPFLSSPDDLPPPPPGPSSRHNDKPNRGNGPVALGVAIGLLLGVGVTDIAYRASGRGPGGGPVAATAPAAVGRSVAGIDVKAILAKVEPAVVSIRETVNNRQGSGTAAGSGMIIGADGLVLTNAHVVAGAVTIQVSISGRGSYSGTVLGADPAADVALVRVSGVSGLPTVTLASTPPAVGDPVVAVGNALALGNSPTVTSGIVSALDRDIDVQGSTLSHLIQTDAAINPGSSGGPLLDAAGTVVGMTSAGATSAQSIGFAIASTNITPLLPRLEKGGTSSSQPAAAAGAYLGISSRDAGPGAQIVEVVSGGPADTAGLQPGDVVIGVDGRAVADSVSLSQTIGSHKPGDVVVLRVQRKGIVATLKATLGSHP